MKPIRVQQNTGVMDDQDRSIYIDENGDLYVYVDGEMDYQQGLERFFPEDIH